LNFRQYPDLEARKPGKEKSLGIEMQEPVFSWLHGFQIQNEAPLRFRRTRALSYPHHNPTTPLTMAPQKATWNGKDSQGNPLRWNAPGLTWNGDIPEPPTKPNRMPIIHVIISFDALTDHGLEELGGTVSADLYIQPAFNTPPGTVPPVTKADLDTAVAAFSKAIVTARQGGPADTADKNDKNDKRAALIALLRQLAAYVDGKHGNNLTLLLSSGFQSTKAGNTPGTVIAAPTLKGVTNGLAGQLLPKVDPAKNAAGYEPRAAVVNPDGTQGPWVSGEFSTSTRGLALNNLIPGTLYAVQVRIHFANHQHSDWSDTAQHRAL
jgi:hypothetical protein